MTLEIQVHGIEPGEPIPDTFAFCVPAETGHAAMGPNRNPRVTWNDPPAGTRSFMLLCVDADAPTIGDDVNQEGRAVAEVLPRADFAHWVLVDIPADVREIPEGADSDGVTPRGKPVGPTSLGVRGQNDYTGWFANDPDMAGTYGGYDGPCPPWNDERVHRYEFTILALDVGTLGLSGAFDMGDARAATAGHVLAEDSIFGTYTLNPSLRAGG